ncbi:DgyrCDS3257 [Dimorphilus gyrociliatus]|nr:DgyrCDS3257 [Dimorphilus gyrociliatus]
MQNGALPNYSIATDLPTYEEAERTKLLEETHRPDFAEGSLILNSEGNSSDLAYEAEVGNDGGFLVCFLISFLFNCIGLLFSVCISHTIAGRSGALAGFGLSMIKWVFIVKQRIWHNRSHHLMGFEPWLWWILVILGLLLFGRGCLQYVIAKKEMRRRRNHGERTFLFAW